jgi:20S proteasome alpha/beta subunit
MIAGYDDYEGAAREFCTLPTPLSSSNTLNFSVYYVDSQGNCVPGNIFSVGSGSISAYSVLDSKIHEFQENVNNLSKEKAIEMALWAVKHATYRDGFSGGYINVLEVNKTGIFHLKRTDCRSLEVGIETKIEK